MSGWSEANPKEHEAEKYLKQFLAKHPQVYALEDSARDGFILLISDIVSGWRNNLKHGPSLDTQRIKWAETKKHSRTLRKALKSLSDDLGDNFDDILAGGNADDGFGASIIAQLEHLERRAERLIENFSGKASDKRNDKFVVMACSEAWANVMGKRPTANQEKSPFFVFLTEVYEVYELGDPPSRTTLQGWLPKQT